MLRTTFFTIAILFLASNSPATAGSFFYAGDSGGSDNFSWHDPDMWDSPDEPSEFPSVGDIVSLGNPANIGSARQALDLRANVQIETLWVDQGIMRPTVMEISPGVSFSASLIGAVGRSSLTAYGQSTLGPQGSLTVDSLSAGGLSIFVVGTNSGLISSAGREIRALEHVTANVIEARQSSVYIQAATIDAGTISASEARVLLSIDTSNSERIFDTDITAGRGQGVRLTAGDIVAESGSTVTLSSSGFNSSSARVSSGDISASNNSSIGVDGDFGNVVLHSSSAVLGGSSTPNADPTAPPKSLKMFGDSFAQVLVGHIPVIEMEGSSELSGIHSTDFIRAEDSSIIGLSGSRIRALEVHDRTWIEATGGDANEIVESLVLGDQTALNLRSGFGAFSSGTVPAKITTPLLRLKDRSLHIAELTGGTLSGHGWIKGDVENGGSILLGQTLFRSGGPNDFFGRTGRPDWKGIVPMADPFDELTASFYVSGDFEQSDSGALDMFLTKSTELSDYADEELTTGLLVSGTASVRGTIKAKLQDGYTPGHNDAFRVVVADKVIKHSDALIVDSPILAHNGLPLVPVHSERTLSLVVPQKVVLAWGQGFFHGYQQVVNELGALIAKPDHTKTLEAADVDAEMQESIRAAVAERFKLSGIESVLIVHGAPDPEAINVHIVAKGAETFELAGEADKVDRKNLNAHNNVWAKYRPPDEVGDGTVETIAHEIGHALGLMHIFEEDEDSIMDYVRIADAEVLFADEVRNVTLPPDYGGRVTALTHNPKFHLRHYVDKVAAEELIEAGIHPGTWDEDVLTQEEYDLKIKTTIHSDIDLYEVNLFTDEMREFGGDIVMSDILASFDHIKVSDLANLLFTVDVGSTFSLIAASTAGGPFDVGLTHNNSFGPGSLRLSPDFGDTRGFLNWQTPGGVQTLAVLGFESQVVPEPSTAILTAIGLLSVATVFGRSPSRPRLRLSAASRFA
ncbi:MAG: hypothetical protein WD851_03460 [Pirellulales bacterium]